MLTVWGRRSSFNLQKVMWLVGELGLEHRHIEAGGQFGGLDAPEFRAMNPHGRVPVIDDDGMIVWESHAILRYLAARHGRERFWSDDPGERSQVDRWMDWSQTALQPDFLMGVFWGFYRTPEAQRNWPAIRDKVNRCAQHFRLLDGMLAHRPFLCGDALTLADIPAGTSLYRYFELDIERPSVPNVEHGTGAWATDRHIVSTSWFRSTSCAAVSTTRGALAGLTRCKSALSPVSALPAERGRSILAAGNRIVRMRRLEPLRIQPCRNSHQRYWRRFWRSAQVRRWRRPRHCRRCPN